MKLQHHRHKSFHSSPPFSSFTAQALPWVPLITAACCHNTNVAAHISDVSRSVYHRSPPKPMCQTQPALAYTTIRCLLPAHAPPYTLPCPRSYYRCTRSLHTVALVQTRTLAGTGSQHELLIHSVLSLSNNQVYTRLRDEYENTSAYISAILTAFMTQDLSTELASRSLRRGPELDL